MSGLFGPDGAISIDWRTIEVPDNGLLRESLVLAAELPQSLLTLRERNPDLGISVAEAFCALGHALVDSDPGMSATVTEGSAQIIRDLGNSVRYGRRGDIDPIGALRTCLAALTVAHTLKDEELERSAVDAFRMAPTLQYDDLEIEESGIRDQYWQVVGAAVYECLHVGNIQFAATLLQIGTDPNDKARVLTVALRTFYGPKCTLPDTAVSSFLLGQSRGVLSALVDRTDPSNPTPYEDLSEALMVAHLRLGKYDDAEQWRSPESGRELGIMTALKFRAALRGDLTEGEEADLTNIVDRFCDLLFNNTLTYEEQKRAYLTLFETAFSEGKSLVGELHFALPDDIEVPVDIGVLASGYIALDLIRTGNVDSGISNLRNVCQEILDDREMDEKKKMQLLHHIFMKTSHIPSEYNPDQAVEMIVDAAFEVFYDDPTNIDIMPFVSDMIIGGYETGIADTSDELYGELREMGLWEQFAHYDPQRAFEVLAERAFSRVRGPDGFDSALMDAEAALKDVILSRVSAEYEVEGIVDLSDDAEDGLNDEDDVDASSDFTHPVYVGLEELVESIEFAEKRALNGDLNRGVSAIRDAVRLARARVNLRPSSPKFFPKTELPVVLARAIGAFSNLASYADGEERQVG